MIDLLLAAVIAIAVLLGLLRGLMGILVPIIAWIAAVVSSFKFGEETAHWLSGNGNPSAMEYIGGYGLTFLVVLGVVLVVGLVVRSLVRASPLSGTDRALGGTIGFLGGISVACVAVAVMAYTPVAREAAWTSSMLRPLLEPPAGWVRSQLTGIVPPTRMADMMGVRGVVIEGLQESELLSSSQLHDTAIQLLRGEHAPTQDGHGAVLPVADSAAAGKATPASTPPGTTSAPDTD